VSGGLELPVERGTDEAISADDKNHDL